MSANGDTLHCYDCVTELDPKAYIPMRVEILPLKWDTVAVCGDCWRKRRAAADAAELKRRRSQLLE